MKVSSVLTNAFLLEKGLRVGICAYSFVTARSPSTSDIPFLRDKYLYAKNLHRNFLRFTPSLPHTCLGRRCDWFLTFLTLYRYVWVIKRWWDSSKAGLGFVFVFVSSGFCQVSTFVAYVCYCLFFVFWSFRLFGSWLVPFRNYSHRNFLIFCNYFFCCCCCFLFWSFRLFDSSYPLRLTWWRGWLLTFLFCWLFINNILDETRNRKL